MQVKKNFIKNYIVLLTFGVIFPFTVFATITDGTIDDVYKYAWSEKIDWVNFGCTACNVHITDSALTGYAWSRNYGWINLAPTTSGVKNNSEGALFGYAWSENLGWIDFSGVTINSSGEFVGSASGDMSGQISFDCANCKVKTDWRPRSSRPQCNNSLDDDNDGKIDYPNDMGCYSLADNDETDPSGGGMLSEWYNPPTPPEGGFKALINQGAKFTNSLIVTLNLFGGPDTEKMAISNFPDFRDANQETFRAFRIWNLCQGLEFCPKEGESYTIYVKSYAPWGKSSQVVSDSIIYHKETVVPSEKKPIVKLPTLIVKPPTKKPPKPPLIERVPEMLKPLIPEFLKPKPPEIKPPEVPLEELVPKESPLVFQDKWHLLPSKPIREFVLAPLPKEIRKLAQKFPKIGETFEQVGISKITDVSKLKTVKLTLPGLTERLGLPTTKVEPGKFALPQGVPTAKLSRAIKKAIPSEIVFVKTGGELIDFNITLNLTEKGEFQQKISTISGKPLQLVVKPDQPVKSIKGYIVFRSKKTSPTSFQLPFNYFTASLIFASPVFAQTQEKPVRIEEKLVLMEFEYTDPDGDGIFTAEIQAPIVEGEYEIITVMDFEDSGSAKKEIRLITVVDPEGYIYEKDGDKETRIPGAIVSLFWLNPETRQYELWPAKEYQQENPQTTDIRGTYSFLVPEGYYYLKIETPGYLAYDGKPFQLKEGSGIHFNIGLKTRYWWLKIVDWKTILLILVIFLLLYNFYRDKIRERMVNPP